MRPRAFTVGLPLLSKELTEMAQRRRTYSVRVLFAALVFTASGLIFLPTYRQAQTAQLGLMGQGAKLLDALYVIEFAGICLFVPAIVSGALAAEKERNTLQLLFLTRLGPWTILLEKLLSRFVPVLTFLLISLPLLFVAYLMGGLTQVDLAFAAAGLILTAFEVGCLAIFCSAFCATSSSAFVMSYLLLAATVGLPFILVACILSLLAILQLFHSDHSAFYLWLNSQEARRSLVPLIMGSVGLNLNWFDNRGIRPFHRSAFPLVFVASLGMLYLLLARLVVLRRAVPQPKHRIRRLFQWLDRNFSQWNERFARGIVLTRSGGSLPEERPIAWRERRRGNLGRVNYLVRILLVVELPILIFSVLLAVLGPDNFAAFTALGFLLWSIALLVIIVRSAGLIAAEKARQTLDILLTTPLELRELMGDKLRGLLRVMVLVAVPILCHALLVSYLQAATGTMRSPYNPPPFHKPAAAATFYFIVTAVSLVILFPLVAQLAFFCGLRARTQGRAVTSALGIFVAWSFIPLFLLVFAKAPAAILCLSPIGGLLVNEFPGLGVDLIQAPRADPGTLDPSYEFHFYVQWGLAAVASFLFSILNRHVAASVLLRGSAAAVSELRAPSRAR
jgi:ABC-type transport system involved in multi-copper enzyme maturation permease subunit